MEDYAEQYNRYRLRYNDECYAVNACERAIATMQEQRRGTVNRINELNTSIRKTRSAISDLQAVLNREDEVTGKMTEVADKVDDASVNYSGMVDYSEVTNKNLNDVFSAEASATRIQVNNIFGTVRSRKMNLEVGVSDMQAQLNSANGELSDLDARIRNERANLGEHQRARSNNFYNMEYYKRKMEEATL